MIIHLLVHEYSWQQLMYLLTAPKQQVVVFPEIHRSYLVYFRLRLEVVLSQVVSEVTVPYFPPLASIQDGCNPFLISRFVQDSTLAY
jgi:hypothetical protein